MSDSHYKVEYMVPRDRELFEEMLRAIEAFNEWNDTPPRLEIVNVYNQIAFTAGWSAALLAESGDENEETAD